MNEMVFYLLNSFDFKTKNEHIELLMRIMKNLDFKAMYN